MKIFLFIVILLTPEGQMPPQTEPMESLDACVARITEMQTQMSAINENFRFTAACVQQSKKADPV